MLPSLGQLRRAKSDIEPGAAMGAGLDHRPEHYVLKDLARVAVSLRNWVDRTYWLF